MRNTLNVTLLQTGLVWENPKENRTRFDAKIKAISEDTDLIILPELFSSGFTMNAAAVAEPMYGDTLLWLKTKAKQKQAALMGSLVILENSKFYNRLVFVEPSGEVSYYNKRHSFTLAGEDKTYTSGTKKVIFNYKGWKICPQICYDLRFPVWARNTSNYDVLVYVANWPKTRIDAWDTLLKARAIENMSYCIGVNRIGKDGNNYEYPGHSAAYDVLGNSLTSLKENEDASQTITLEKNHINTYRNKLKFLDDKDHFNLIE